MANEKDKKDAVEYLPLTRPASSDEVNSAKYRAMKALEGKKTLGVLPKEWFYSFEETPEALRKSVGEARARAALTQLDLPMKELLKIGLRTMVKDSDYAMFGVDSDGDGKIDSSLFNAVPRDKDGKKLWKTMPFHPIEGAPGADALAQWMLGDKGDISAFREAVVSIAGRTADPEASLGAAIAQAAHDRLKELADPARAKAIQEDAATLSAAAKAAKTGKAQPGEVELAGKFACSLISPSKPAQQACEAAILGQIEKMKALRKSGVDAEAKALEQAGNDICERSAEGPKQVASCKVAVADSIKRYRQQAENPSPLDMALNSLPTYHRK